MKTDITVFQPAYRWDALIVFPKAGTYCVVDASAPTSALSSPPSRQLLGFVRVNGRTTVPGDLSDYVRQQLVRAATVQMPVLVRAKVIADLNNGLRLTSFTGHPDITDAEVTGTQELTFNIDFSAGPPQFQVDGKPYDDSRVDRVLTLGKVDQWTLTSAFVSHPFHIHINPFQIVKILDPNGRDVSAAGAVDDYGVPSSGAPDPQYRGLKGAWKDVLWIKNVQGGKYTVVVRTRYRRYIGDFVLHCHILDHEDQGMMHRIRIALPE
jgi:FtsP/CotA-like multicopper oxidase with cupredoxin domain